ncbi:MAG: hypothetical protein KDC38_07050 [Planctomycetes bacterium]|nr:hypothetical protein [Planctomycetota bacterium]
MSTRTWLLGFAVVISALSSVAAQSDAPPTEKKPAEKETSEKPKVDPEAKAVLEKFLKATGGAEAHAKLRTRRMTGTFELPAQNIKGTTTGLQRRPTDSVMTIDIPQMGSEKHGSLGDVAWEVTQLGPRLKSPEETAQLLRTNYLDLPVRFPTLYERIEYKGEVEFRGKRCARLDCTPPPLVDETGKKTPQSVEVYYFDLETGLNHAAEFESKTQMGRLKIVMTNSDYREIDGIKIPFVSKQEIPSVGMVITMKVEKVEHNVDVTDADLALPEDIQKLIERQKEGAGKG